LTVTVRPARTRRGRPPATNRVFLFLSLGAASFVVLGGVLLFLQARAPDFAQTREGLASHRILNLNDIRAPAQLVPYLNAYHSARLRADAAQTLFSRIDRARPIRNLRWMRSALAPVTQSLGASDPDFALNPAPALEQTFVVRTPEEFVQSLWLSLAMYFAVFYVVAAIWWWRDFRGDVSLLPPLHLLTGIALITLLSLRNPARDELLFPNFAQGTLGALLLALPAFSFFDYRRLAGLGRSSKGRRVLLYAPLAMIAALFIALKSRGTSATGDANINLWGFQPVELIKLLIVIFYAGYFSQKWERLRDVREKHFGMRRMPFRVPQFKHLLPLLVSTAVALFIFKLLNDLGPALVIACLFLLLYGVALARPGLPVVGFLLLVGTFVLASYNFLSPKLAIRVGMWQSPWNNTLRHGDQLVKSFWGLATGGPLGSGIGWGDAWLIPTNHTDMIYSSIGEEWGFVGLAAVFLLYGWIAFRSLRIARRAPSDYPFFLALGAILLLVLQGAVIIGGVIGAIPLSGVPTPFLCWGRSSMLVNFFLIAIILAVSARAASNEPVRASFEAPLRWMLGVIACIGAVLLVRTAWIDVIRADAIFGRPATVLVENVRKGGGPRTPGAATISASIYNPRIALVESQIPRGDIYGRNGVLLATSSWNHLENQAAGLKQFGVSLDRCCQPSEERFYPFGSVTYHLLGDNVEKARFGASDAAFVEKIADGQLRGYQSIRDILPAVRRRRQPNQPALQKILARDRDVHLTLDLRLQQRALQILTDALSRAHKSAGAAIVIDLDSGAILASVNVPAPLETHPREPLDPMSLPASQRAAAREQLRPFEDVARLGSFAPGSTFKLVTAMAALRKDPALLSQKESCIRLEDGRAGAKINGYGRVIHDDIGDLPHGTLAMSDALRVSCNAYFAQLAAYQVGAPKLAETASLFGIRTVRPVRADADHPQASILRLRRLLPDSGYGQGEVTASPLQMALVSSVIANQGLLPEAHLLEASGSMPHAEAVLAPSSAAALAQAMRSVVTAGTARKFLSGAAIPIAGKTGTAQIDRRPGATAEETLAHSWFAGFAPLQGGKRIAFAVFVEHGGYGGALAAPIAGELVTAARQLGII
jgi:cell division protein FtsI/penicillin-binding protein 2/cell division protein FtsW (lipid II flippase)